MCSYIVLYLLNMSTYRGDYSAAQLAGLEGGRYEARIIARSGCREGWKDDARDSFAKGKDATICVTELMQHHAAC